MIRLLPSSLFFLVFSVAYGGPFEADVLPWHGRIYSAQNTVALTEDELIEQTSLVSQVILGEKHLTPAVQKRQAWVIEKTLERDFFPNPRWALAWEFLNRKDRAQIQAVIGSYFGGQLNTLETLQRLMGSAQYESYAPLFEVLKKFQGKLAPLNLTRQEKAPVVQYGLEALAPGLMPPQFKMGGEKYFARFREAMGNHASEQKLKNYFAAQCLTDDVMAYEWSQLITVDRRFLVAGSFHTDFSDGLVARIRERVPNENMVVLRFIDAADFRREDLEEKWQSLLVDPHYGQVADYVLFVNEPDSR